MPSWYDYIPGVGAATRAIQGNGEQALIDLAAPVGPAAQWGIGKINAGNKAQTQGFYAAANADTALADKQRALAMQGLGQAENYYAPAAARIKAAYGDPGSVTR